MANIKRLLNKKGWTGKELGQIEIANMAHMFDQQIHGKTPTPLVTNEDFTQMLNSINDPVQGKAYNDYIKIHKWLSIAYNVTSGQEQQAQSNFKTLLNYISVARAIENTYAYIEKLPVIMTQKQYNDFVEKRKNEIVNPKGGIGFGMFNMFIEALESLVNQLQSNPRKTNPLKTLKPKLEKELVKDPRILKRYNEVMGNGYYTIDETGERSDQMTQEEWQKAISSPELSDAMDNRYGKPVPKSFTRIAEVAKATFNGATEDEIKNIENKYRMTKPVTFHLYENPPEDLNKWEILETGDLFEYYRSLEGADEEGNELPNDKYDQAILEDVKAFKKEFPTVFKAVLKDMHKYIGDVADTPIEEWNTITYEWKDLYKANYYSFNETYLDDISIFDGNKKAIFNGVAILQEGTFNKLTIDDNGYYKAPNVWGSLADLSLEAFFTDSRNYADNTEDVEIARETLLESYYYMLGFNKALDLIEDYFDLPQLEVFKFNTSAMANRMEAFDSLVAMLFKDIKERDYEDKNLQNKKLDVLKNFFFPLECNKITIPQENIDKVINSFSDSKIFEDSNLTNLLCVRR